jgi:hypothetical protein
MLSRLAPAHWASSERRQVESARRTSAGCRRASSDSRRGWGRRHQSVVFPFTCISRGLFSSTQLIILHYTARLWCAFTTQSMAIAYASSRQPKPKVRLLTSFCPVVVDIGFSLLIDDHYIRLEFYGTQLTISATRMVARRFLLLPSHASRGRPHAGSIVSPSCHNAPRAIPGC